MEAGGTSSVPIRYGRLVTRRHQERGPQARVGFEPVRVGKSPENDFVINDDSVSRVHCEFWRDGRGYWVRDLQSTNGTFVDGIEIKEAQLQPGALVRVGTVELAFTHHEEVVEVPPWPHPVFGTVAIHSPALASIAGVLTFCANAQASVLFLGPSGVGRRTLAQAMHQTSTRSPHHCVVIDCAVSDSEFERVAWGDPETPNVRGKFAVAHRGTLILHEVTELSLEMQARILRVLETKQVPGFGARATIPVDVRVCATSAKPLTLAVARQHMRADFAARMSEFCVEIPPLVRRPDDLAALWAQATNGADLPPWLHEMPWPGNARELLALAAAYPAQASRNGDTPIAFSVDHSFREHKEHWIVKFERAYVQWLLTEYDGNISRAARAADMDRKHLYSLLRRYQFKDPEAEAVNAEGGLLRRNPTAPPRRKATENK